MSNMWKSQEIRKGTSMGKILSVEIKHSEVRVVQIEKKGKKSRILSSFRFFIPNGLLEDGFIQDPQELGNKLKEELEKRNLHKVKKVCFSIYSTRIASKEVYLPFVKKKRIMDMIEVNANEYFPVDISQYVLSYDIIDIIEEKSEAVAQEKQEKKENKQYHLMIYATPKALTSCYKELAQNAELELIAMDYSNNSIYHAVKKEYETGVHMMIKIEENESVITIIRDGKLSLQRSLNYGLDAALETVISNPIFNAGGDMQKGWEILYRKKCIYPTLDMERIEQYRERDSYEIWEGKREITESFRYLIGNISRIMDYYISRHAGVEFSSISYGGAGCEVKGLGELLTEELRQEIFPIKELKGLKYDKTLSEEHDILGVFIANVGSMYADMNIMEHVVQKKDKEQLGLGGAWLIFGAGAVAAIALSSFSLTTHYFTQKEKERLTAEISKRQEAEQIYNAYVEQKNTYEQMKSIFEYTKTPNENLVSFLEEMEEKMPSSILVESFSSTGSDVNFSVKVPSKAVAAKVIMQLRTFERLSDVSVSSLTKNESGEYLFSVACTYAESAKITVSQENS